MLIVATCHELGVILTDLKKKKSVHEIKINSVSRIYIDIFHEDQIKSKKSRKKNKENNTEILKFKVVSRFPLTSTSIINVFLDRT